MKRRGVGVLVVLLTVAMLVWVPVGSTAASAPPTLTVTLREDPAQPHFVSDAGRVFVVDVTSAGGPAEDVTVTFSGPDVESSPASADLGTVDGTETAAARVGLLSGGFHTLTVEVGSSNAGTASASLPLLWAAGGTPLPATGNLVGRHYGWRVDRYEVHVGYVHDDYQLSFLDDHRAYIGAAPKGRPRCPSVVEHGYRGCVPYRYDASTGLVQIGGFIGRVLGNDLYISGIGRAENVNSVSERVVSQRWRYARKRMVFSGQWRWDDLLHGSTRFVVDLTLRPDRTFRLVTGTNEQPVEMSGTFRIPRHGKLVLLGTNSREVHSLGVRLGPDGQPAPGLGLWFTGSYRGSLASFRLDPVT
jgi:hypothetical protein